MKRSPYTYAALTTLRDGFWADHPQFAAERRKRKRQNDYRTDIRCAFVDWLDNANRSGQVSPSLADRATL